MRGLLLGFAIAAFAMVGAVRQPGSPQGYLVHAMRLVRTRAVVSPAGGWPAQTIYALDTLYQSGDVHARFANPLTAKLQAEALKAVGTTTTPPPTVSILERKIGVIDIPAIGSSPTSPNSRRYMTAALSAIRAAQTASAPCGWIVDLRQNTGGDMYPMLLSLGPILGNGTLVGFTGRGGFTGYATYTDGVIAIGRSRFRAPLLVSAFSPLPPVAVLTGPATLSSGEAVAIAFRGRQGTRSFGASTGGATTSPQTFRLSDGAAITFSTAYDVDRNGVIYRKPIPPDQPTNPLADSAATESAAEQWLLATAACSVGE